MNNEKPKKIPKQYSCEFCHFFTYNKKDFNRHLLTRKHLILANKDDNEMNEKKLGFTCEHCNKFYKYVSGLSRHKKKCIPIKSNNKNEKQIDSVMEKTNNLIKENQDLMKILLESIPKINNIDYNTGTCQNNSVNVYLFVNKRKSNIEESNVNESKIDS